jgi:general secretion pathway protein C
MKRMPLLFSLLALIALSASIAYWVLQLYSPQQRPLAPPPTMSQSEPAIEAASTLFGGQLASAAPSNYQLTGVVAAGADSVAIIVADGSPPKAFVQGREVAAGVTLKEVHPRFVLLSEGGVMKRVELATDAKAGTGLTPGAGAGAPPIPGAPPSPGAPPPVQMPAQPAVTVVTPSANPPLQ